MNFKDINNVHFIGVGGIGMSALARYFQSQGKKVSGYDKTETALTRSLTNEGICVYFSDTAEKVLAVYDKKDTLVIYTPAVPDSFQELRFFIEEGYTVIKRAKALGIISEAFETYAVAGTHGKTTTSAILAHVLYETEEQCNAFIGGITSNYNSNCIIAPKSDRIVVEADEFDRSFLQLKPSFAIVTTMDADHLDIYGDSDMLHASFNDFVNLVNPAGHIFFQADLDTSEFNMNPTKNTSTYGFSETAQWRGENLRYNSGRFFFDIRTDHNLYEHIEFGLPGKHNAENAIAVFGLALTVGISEEQVRSAFKSFKGVKRRFDYHIRTEDLVIIDDYAHHPTEIVAFLSSVNEIYPDKKITAVFQPHLFSRTRDFMDEFVSALKMADELFLLDIYPAREQPIEGITSDLLLEKIDAVTAFKSSKQNIVADLHQSSKEVLVILGAGDIDTCIQPIVNSYSV